MKQILFIASIVFLGCDVQTQNEASRNQQLKTDSLINASKGISDSIKKAEEKNKLNRLKLIKETSTVKVNDVSLKFLNVSTSNNWIHDNYGSEYFYNSSERGNIFIVARISISADTKNPNLPPISILTLKKNEIICIGNLTYKFTKWADYGTYLGNYADYGNDFAHTKTISFTCGLEISNTDLNFPVYVAVKKENTYARREERFHTPPVFI